MERLKKLLPSVMAHAPKTLLATLILAAIGLVAERQSTVIGSPPWMAAAFLCAAGLTFLYSLVRYVRFKSDIPYAVHRLFKREKVNFNEIANVIAENYPKVYSREQVLHQLMKPMWKGEFEWSAGAFGKVNFPELDTKKSNHKIRIIKSSTRKYTPKHIHLNPAYNSLSRRDLLKPDLGIDKIYPGFDTLQKDVLNDKSVSWSKLKNQIDFEFLATVEPREYAPEYMQNYIHNLTIDGPTLQKWFKKFQAGEFRT